jgi:predicted glycosyltransferase
MRIWLDMSNSPHPLLFAPLARRIQRRGHEVVVTARDNAQTRELTLQRWPGAEVIGVPSRPGRLRKGALILERARALRRWGGARGIDVALSHNSYAQILAARSLGIRTVTAMDYEYQPANHLAFRLASRVVVPDAFPASHAQREGAREGKVRRYAGLKEEIYLGDFEPDKGVMRALGVSRDPSRSLVVVRTPPSGAAYHQFENPGFRRLLESLQVQPACMCVVLARTPEQRESLAEAFPSMVFPHQAVDSRSLIYAADLFIGAGGTMTREAALMGVPTCSLYAGKRPSVDRELERRGLLRSASGPETVGEVKPRRAEPRAVTELRQRAERISASFLDAALG